VNPISGVGKQKVVPKWVQSMLDPELYTYDIVYTEAPRHAIELAKQAATEKVDIVAIVGGDGSVNEAGSALLFSQTALAIIPTGSGNGLALHLGIPTQPQQAIAMLNTHKKTKIDTGTLNGIPFIGVAGIGFDAHIAHEFAQFGKRGFFSYFKIILKEYMKYEEDEYAVESPNTNIKANAFLLTVANSSQYGNRATIAPTARLDDGHLKLCLLRKFPWYAAPFVAFRLFNKSIHRSKYMHILDDTEFRIEMHNDRAHVDGEPLVLEESLDVKIVPASLTVVVPV